MRGIPSSYLFIFFATVFFIELISYFGFRQLIKNAAIKIRLSITLFYLGLTLSAFAILFYAFSNPEIIRQSKDYSFFYIVIIVAVLNLVPKCFYALMTILSFIVRLGFGVRKQEIVLTGSFLIVTGLVSVFLYGIFVGRNQVYVDHEDLYFDNLPEQLEDLKIIQISDIHLGSLNQNPQVLKNSIKKITALQPDLLLFTGDIVNNFSDELNLFKPYLTQFSAKYGKYAILGNHDYGDYYSWPDSLSKKENLIQIKKGITEVGFKLLLNESEKIKIKDTAFTLIGVENWGHHPFPQYANLHKAMNGIPANMFRILMSHDPAHWESVVVPQTDIPLTLSGHTHAGQVGIRIAGLAFSPIYLHQKLWGGLYKSENQFLYVNRGLGTIGFLGRIEMYPEITLLILHRTKNH